VQPLGARVEEVVVTPPVGRAEALIVRSRMTRRRRKIPADSIAEHLYTYQNAEAIRHLFRVTASLDSMMLGEPQILGQVKEAWRLAAEAGPGSPRLKQLRRRCRRS